MDELPALLVKAMRDAARDDDERLGINKNYPRLDAIIKAKVENLKSEWNTYISRLTIDYKDALISGTHAYDKIFGCFTGIIKQLDFIIDTIEHHRQYDSASDSNCRWNWTLPSFASFSEKTNHHQSLSIISTLSMINC